MELVIAAIGAYILGSFPTAVIAGKLFAGIDVREHGSGNAGATNTLRVLGYQLAIPVLLLDVAKGVFATRLVYLEALKTGFIISNEIEAKLALGILAVVGHIFPIFAGFKGGKGIATFSGVIIGVHTQSALISVAVFLVVVSLTRYVSLGSIVGAIFYPVQLIFIFQMDSPFVKIFSILTPLMILYTHRKNIDRLLKGEENKISFAKN